MDSIVVFVVFESPPPHSRKQCEFTKKTPKRVDVCVIVDPPKALARRAAKSKKKKFPYIHTSERALPALWSSAIATAAALLRRGPFNRRRLGFSQLPAQCTKCVFPAKVCDNYAPEKIAITVVST